jgi:hypothetical protein
MVGSSSRTAAFHPATPAEYTSAGSAIMPAETLSRVLGNAGAIASSRTGDPSIGEFEDAPDRPQTRSGSTSQMGQNAKYSERADDFRLTP